MSVNHKGENQVSIPIKLCQSVEEAFINDPNYQLRQVGRPR